LNYERSSRNVGSTKYVDLDMLIRHACTLAHMQARTQVLSL